MVELSPKRVAIMFSSGVLSSAGTVSKVQTNNLPQSSTSMAEMVEKYLSMLAKASTGADLLALKPSPSKMAILMAAAPKMATAAATMPAEVKKTEVVPLVKAKEAPELRERAPKVKVAVAGS